MTIQIGRMELIISITAGGETVAVFLGSLETAWKLEKPVGGWKEKPFQGTDPVCAP